MALRKIMAFHLARGARQTYRARLLKRGLVTAPIALGSTFTYLEEAIINVCFEMCGNWTLKRSRGRYCRLKALLPPADGVILQL